MAPGGALTLAWSEGSRRPRGVTDCDSDEDGDLDVYVSSYRLQPNRLWLNDGRGGFTDVASEWNALATSPGFAGGHSIGAQVRVRAGERIVVRQVEAGTGEGNANDLVLHFGLGGRAGPVTVEVRRPGQEPERLELEGVDRRPVLPASGPR